MEGIRPVRPAAPPSAAARVDTAATPTVRTDLPAALTVPRPVAPPGMGLTGRPTAAPRARRRGLEIDPLNEGLIFGAGDAAEADRPDPEAALRLRLYRSPRDLPEGETAG